LEGAGIEVSCRVVTPKVFSAVNAINVAPLTAGSLSKIEVIDFGQRKCLEKLLPPGCLGKFKDMSPQLDTTL
jgi:hypothetical protein